MAQITQDDLSPQSFASLLMPQQDQQQVPQLPPASAPGDVGMADVLQPAAATGGNGPSLLDKGREFTAQNPVLAQVLLHTFMRMAQGGGRNFADSLGQGIAAGAQAGLMHMAQGKQDAEQQAKIQREQAAEQRKADLENRRVNVQEGDLSLRREAQPADIAYKQAVTKKVGTEATNAEAMLQPQIEAINAKIAAVKQQILGEQDSLKTAALRRQLMGLQITQEAFKNDLDKKFAEAERGTTVAGKMLTNRVTSAKATEAEQEAQDLTTLTPEQRLARSTPHPSAQAKSDADRKLAFISKNADLFVDAQGNFNADAANKKWAELQQTPEATAAGQEAMRQKMLAARNAVKVGEVYTGPDGKLYKRKN